LSAAIARASEANEGVDVCSTAGSKFFASATTSASENPCCGASISLLVWHEGRGLRDPGRIPERPDLAF
jgi:hypothetical protein